MKDEAQERFDILARAFLSPFANKADHEEAGDNKNTDLDWDVPVTGHPDAVETVLTLIFKVGDSSTCIEFWFTCNMCNSTTFMDRATLYSDYGDGHTQLVHAYRWDEARKLYEKYSKYLDN